MDLKICVVPNCNNKCFKDICYKHNVKKYKLTNYYHNIGDKIINEIFELPDEKIVQSYNTLKINDLIKKLRYMWICLNKCLTARENLSILYFGTMDKKHEFYINNTIKPKMRYIEEYQITCYKKLIKTMNNDINLEESRYNLVKDYNTKLNNKNKVKRNQNKKEKTYDYKILDSYIRKNVKKLEDINLYNQICSYIKKKNYEIKQIFFRNNILYNNFMQKLFGQYNFNFITLKIDSKMELNFYTYDNLLDKEEIFTELYIFTKFKDDLFEIYDRIYYISKNIQSNFLHIYTISKVNKTYCYDYIKKYYNIVNINFINNKIEFTLKNIKLDVAEIFNELELLNDSFFKPNNNKEFLCFYIFNKIDMTNKIETKILFFSCIKEGIFYICEDTEPTILDNKYSLKKILTTSCYIYCLKYVNNDSIDLNILDLIRNNTINIEITDNKSNIIYDKKMLNNEFYILIHYDCKKMNY